MELIAATFRHFARACCSLWCRRLCLACFSLCRCCCSAVNFVDVDNGAKTTTVDDDDKTTVYDDDNDDNTTDEELALHCFCDMISKSQDNTLAEWVSEQYPKCLPARVVSVVSSVRRDNNPNNNPNETATIQWYETDKHGNKKPVPIIGSPSSDLVVSTFAPQRQFVHPLFSYKPGDIVPMNEVRRVFSFRVDLTRPCWSNLRLPISLNIISPVNAYRNRHLFLMAHEEEMEENAQTDSSNHGQQL